MHLTRWYKNGKTYNEGAGEPEHGRQEGEGDSGLPPLTRALLGNIAPSPDATAPEGTDEVHEQTEGNHPQDEQDQVDDVVDHGGGEGNEPDQGEEHGEAGHDFGIDKALLRP